MLLAWSLSATTSTSGLQWCPDDAPTRATIRVRPTTDFPEPMVAPGEATDRPIYFSAWLGGWGTQLSRSPNTQFPSQQSSNRLILSSTTAPSSQVRGLNITLKRVAANLV
ncbi:hypothetical protein JB92DRAFT_3100799, partial [Gautieria morchelliformis]